MGIVYGKTADQIARVDAKGCFMEVRSALFDAKKEGKTGKVMLNFVEYDTNTNKTTRSIACYVDLPKMVELTDEIRLHFIDQDLKREIARAQQTGDKYCKSIWADMGGTSASILASKGKARQDGKSESRIFEIVPAAKEGHVMLRAKRGPGIEQQKGIIAPDYKGGTFEQINVLCSLTDLRSIAKLVDISVTAYETRRWMKGAHDYIYDASATGGSQAQTNNSEGYYPMTPQNRQQAAPQGVPQNVPQNNQPANQPAPQNPQTLIQPAPQGNPPMSQPSAFSPASQGFGQFSAPTDEELSDAGFFPFQQAQ